MFVADKYSNQIKVLSRELRLVHVPGDPRPRWGPKVFDRAEGVTKGQDRSGSRTRTKTAVSATGCGTEAAVFAHAAILSDAIVNFNSTVSRLCL